MSLHDVFEHRPVMRDGGFAGSPAQGGQFIDLERGRVFDDAGLTMNNESAANRTFESYVNLGLTKPEVVFLIERLVDAKTKGIVSKLVDTLQYQRLGVADVWAGLIVRRSGGFAIDFDTMAITTCHF